MNRRFKTLFSTTLLLISSLFCNAQEESPLQIGADLMSRYVWRGVNFGGSSPSIQPWIKYNLTKAESKHELTIGSWAAYTFSETSNQEVDLYLTYTYNKVVSLTFTDYFFPEQFESKSRSRYFNYDKDSTAHVFEAIASFNGTENIPFTLLFAMNLYGNDARKINSDGSNGDIFMSKYVELGYSKSINGVDFNAFIGAVLDKPNKNREETGFYGNETAGVINLGIKASKQIQINEKLSIPVQASLITNPERENIYLVFGMSF
ncbi:MAG: hypothetical protein AB7S48_03060 [Bacteroidales bacterium]